VQFLEIISKMRGKSFDKRERAREIISIEQDGGGGRGFSRENDIKLKILIIVMEGI
jgi:hypothetical protein